MIGCGFYAGPCAAVACTGTGEQIIKRMLARTVYDLVARSEPVREACREGIRPFPSDSPVGVIAISRSGHAVVSNRPMAHYALIDQGP
jgi:L-asparaginase / beta-aspartyl-peptidase